MVEKPETLRPFADIPPANVEVAFASPLIVVVAVFPTDSESKIETKVDDAWFIVVKPETLTLP